MCSSTSTPHSNPHWGFKNHTKLMFLEVVILWLWALLIPLHLGDCHQVPTGPQIITALKFLRERMPYPSQVCKTLSKLMLMAVNKCNQVSSKHSQALTQNIFQIKSCNTDKGHLPEINIWKQTPECSRLTLVMMIFTFTTSNICNNRPLFYPVCDTHKET